MQTKKPFATALRMSISAPSKRQHAGRQGNLQRPCEKQIGGDRKDDRRRNIDERSSLVEIRRQQRQIYRRRHDISQPLKREKIRKRQERNRENDDLPLAASRWLGFALLRPRLPPSFVNQHRSREQQGAPQQNGKHPRANRIAEGSHMNGCKNGVEICSGKPKGPCKQDGVWHVASGGECW